MATFLDPIRDLLFAIRDILRTLLDILIIFKKHVLFTIILIVVVAFYSAGLWCTYVIPKQTIQKFYRLIQEKADANDCWNMLDRNYQKIWIGDPDRFLLGYKTTVAYSDMRIDTQGRAWNPLGFLFFNSLTFDVSFVVEDRLSRDDLLDPIQQRSNAKWLAIAHSTDYPRLADGTLGFETLPMRRRFRQIMVLKRSTWNSWLISNIRNRECALVFD